jgi:hypothetical protein
MFYYVIFCYDCQEIDGNDYSFYQVAGEDLEDCASVSEQSLPISK